MASLRVLVCGGRDFADKREVYNTLDRLCVERGLKSPEDEFGNWLPAGVTIIHGGARGADWLADDWAVVNWVPVEEYRADWEAHGKAAGALRNQRMLDEGRPGLVVAFPGGRGTADMTRRAKKSRHPHFSYCKRGITPLCRGMANGAKPMKTYKAENRGAYWLLIDTRSGEPASYPTNERNCKAEARQMNALYAEFAGVRSAGVR